MVIHVYTILRNEEYILPYFLRHYETFADKIFVIDDHSTDKTVEIAKECSKVVVSTFDYPESENYDDYFSECFTKKYKEESRGIADWVIRVDADELIYDKDDIKLILEEQKKKGSKVLKSSGYMMVSKELPDTEGQIYDQCKKGMRIRSYDKTVIFNPELDVTFTKGRHFIELPEGVVATRTSILLLHYRYLSKDYFVSKSKHLYSRKGELTESLKKKLMKKGLNWYEDTLQSKLLKDVI